MRKLLLASFVFISLQSYSQETTPTPASEFDKFRFGLHFSPNIGWEKPDNDNVEMKGLVVGYGFGLMTEFNLSKRYSVLTGVNVNKAGHRNSTFNGTDYSEVRQIRTSYVEIPVSLKLKTNEIGYLTYFGKFGLAPSIATSSRYETEGGSRGKFDYTTGVRMGLLIGIGAEYNLSGNTSLMFGLDFNNGFTNIYTRKAGYDLKGNRFNSINNIMQLTFGVFF